MDPLWKSWPWHTGALCYCLMPEVALPGRHCQGTGVQPGHRGDPKHILTHLQVPSMPRPVFPALPGHKESLPHLATAWPCLQPQGKGSTDFCLRSCREEQPHSSPGWTGESQVWVWINLPLSQTVARAHRIPEPGRGMGISPRERILQQHSCGHKISPSAVWGREGMSGLRSAGEGHRMETSRD